MTVVSGFDLFGGKNIKSTQSGSLTIANGNTSGLTNLTPIDITKSIVIITGISYSHSSYNVYNIHTRARLTGTNQIPQLELIRGNSVYDISVSWIVIEFENVKSIQEVRSSPAFSSTFLNISISPVDTSKSAIFFSYYVVSSLSTSNVAANTFRSFFASSSAVRLSRGSSDTSQIAYCVYVVEFE